MNYDLTVDIAGHKGLHYAIEPLSVRNPLILLTVAK